MSANILTKKIMKEINQIIHLTNSMDRLKSILKNGFYTSYAKENFGDKNILIPMISFANILFRDIGEREVINYGNYGIVFDREHIIEKFNLNPVFYVKNGSELENIFVQNLQISIIPQILHKAKEFYKQTKKEKFSDYIELNPISEEEKKLLDTLDSDVNDDFIHSVKIIFEKYFVNTMQQVLLLKPYKIEDKQNETKIAYNEREWRKSFLDLNYISEIKPTGEKNNEYEKWIKTPKPHFANKYILNFKPSDVKFIYVENQKEVLEIEKFIRDNLKSEIEVYTLNYLKLRENK